MMPDWEEDGTPGHGVGTLAETAKQIESRRCSRSCCTTTTSPPWSSWSIFCSTFFTARRRRHCTSCWRCIIRGVGVAGVYPYEIAEAKVNKVTELAGAQDYPLLCTLEQE